MSEPIIFIAHQKIKHGKVEEYKAHYQESEVGKKRVKKWLTTLLD